MSGDGGIVQNEVTRRVNLQSLSRETQGAVLSTVAGVRKALTDLDSSSLSSSGSAGASPLLGDGGVEKARKLYLDSMKKYMVLRRQETLMENLVREEPLAAATFDAPLPEHAEEEISKAKESVAEACEELAALIGRVTGEGDKLEAEVRSIATSVVSKWRELKRMRNQAFSLESLQEDAMQSEEETQKLEREADNAEKELREVLAQREELEVQLAQSEAELQEISQVEKTSGSGRKRQKRGRSNEVGGIPATAKRSEADEFLKAVLEEKEGLRRRRTRALEARDWYAGVIAAVEALGGFSATVEEGSIGADQGENPVVQLLLRYHGNSVGGEFVARLQLEEQSHALLGAQVDLPKSRSARKLEALNECVDELVDDVKGNSSSGIEAVRKLARELPVIVRSTQQLEEHIKKLREKYLVSWRPRESKVTATLRGGVTLEFHLRNFYGSCPGGVILTDIAGVNGWTEAEIEELRQSVNGVGHLTVLNLVSEVETRAEALKGSLTKKRVL